MVVVIWNNHKTWHSRPLRVVGVLALLLWAIGWLYDYYKCSVTIYLLFFFTFQIHNIYKIYYNLHNVCRI